MDKETLAGHFSYDFESGVFSRINRKNSNGSLDKDGYLILKIKKKQYKAHRMAWLYHYGSMPTDNIDHINGDRLDNKIKNLRVLNQAGNMKNSTVKVNLDTGYKGVYIDRTKGLKKIFATKPLGKTHRFNTALEASNFRNNLLREAGYGDRHF